MQRNPTYKQKESVQLSCDIAIPAIRNVNTFILFKI